MKSRRKKNINPRILFFVLAFICIIFFALSVFKGYSGGGARSALNAVLSPMQSGINGLGSLASGIADKRKTVQDYEDENQALQDKIDMLQSQLVAMQYNLAEYQDLLDLLELSEKYPAYEMTAARIIAKDPGNWYSTFTINKGSADGIKENMNVIAGNGLVGIVIEVNEHTAVVRSIVDDSSNVSAMFTKSLDLCIVNGDLKMIDSGLLNVELISADTQVLKGDEIVTSYISDRFLPGILIGYINEETSEVSDVTHTATLTPAVDFQHLSTVLVIMQLKEDLSNDLTYGRGYQETYETQTEESESDAESESASESESSESASEAE